MSGSSSSLVPLRTDYVKLCTSVLTNTKTGYIPNHRGENVIRSVVYLKVNHLLRFVSTYSSFTLPKRYNLRSNHRCNWCWQSKTHRPPTQSHVYLPGRRTWFPRPLQLPRHANALQAILLPAAPRKLRIRSHCFGDQASRRNRSPFFLCRSNWSHQLLRERQCISWFPD